MKGKLSACCTRDFLCELRNCLVPLRTFFLTPVLEWQRLLLFGCDWRVKDAEPQWRWRRELVAEEEEEQVLVRGCPRALQGLGLCRSYRDFKVIWIRTEILWRWTLEKVPSSSGLFCLLFIQSSALATGHSGANTKKCNWNKNRFWSFLWVEQ